MNAGFVISFWDWTERMKMKAFKVKLG